MIRAVIFDLDGTLLNTLDDLSDSTNFALRSVGFKERSVDEVRRFVGNGVYKLIERAVPTNTDIEAIKRVYEIFKTHYVNNSCNKTAPYVGIKELINELLKFDVKVAIVSNKLNEAVGLLRDMYFPMIDVAIGETPVVMKKPAPDMVFEAAKKLSVNLKDIVYIGDSEVDIETARNAGVECISVAWGFRTEEELLRSGAKCIVQKPIEIYDVIMAKR